MKLSNHSTFSEYQKNQDFKNTQHRHGEYNKNFWNKKFFFKQILISFSTKKAVETICIKTKIIFISFVFCPYCAWLIKKLFNNRRGCLLHESVKIVVSAYPNPQFDHQLMKLVTEVGNYSSSSAVDTLLLHNENLPEPTRKNGFELK